MAKNNEITFGITPKSYRLMTTALRETPGLEKAVIFGSRAMGNYKRGSDIDVVVFGDISNRELDNLIAKLNERLPIPYRFDIVLMSQIKSPELIAHIEEYGKEIPLEESSKIIE